MEKKLRFKSRYLYSVLAFLAFATSVEAMDKKSTWITVPEYHQIFDFPLSSLGENIFEAILSSMPDSSLDNAAKLGKADGEIIGIIRSSEDYFESGDLAFNEAINLNVQIYQMIDNIKPWYGRAQKSLFGDLFSVKNFKITVRGKGITTHGNFLREVTPGSYHEDIALDQLPYASLNTGNAILRRNQLFIDRKSMTKFECTFASVRKNAEDGTFLLTGKIAVKLYLLGHSYNELEHDIEIELDRKNSESKL